MADWRFAAAISVILSGLVSTASAQSSGAQAPPAASPPPAPAKPNTPTVPLGGIVDAGRWFSIGGSRVLFFDAVNATMAAMGDPCGAPSFCGTAFGVRNTSFGYEAGYTASGNGSDNALFGYRADLAGAGGENAVFGSQAGIGGAVVTSGSSNSFFGYRAGAPIKSGTKNVFVGWHAGDPGEEFSNQNTAVGAEAGISTVPESQANNNKNTFVGAHTTRLADSITNATAIGADAAVTQSNSIVLGSIAGINGASSDTNVGIGTNTPVDKLHVSGTGIVRPRINSDSNAGLGLMLNDQQKWSVATVGGGQFQIFNDAIGQNAVWIDPATNNVGIGTTTVDDKLVVNGVLRLNALGTIGGTQLCRNASNQIANCSSSMRYKTNIATLDSGLRLIDRLRPVRFEWKQSHEPDLGLVAEEVAEVEPLLVTRNDQGEIEGVKYDRVSVVLINALKEQQAQIANQQRQIEQQQRAIERQQQQIDALRETACSSNGYAKGCRKE